MAQQDQDHVAERLTEHLIDCGERWGKTDKHLENIDGEIKRLGTTMDQRFEGMKKANAERAEKQDKRAEADYWRIIRWLVVITFGVGMALEFVTFGILSKMAGGSIELIDKIPK